MIRQDLKAFGVATLPATKYRYPVLTGDIQRRCRDLLMAEIDGDEENNVIFTTSGVAVR